MRIEHDHLALWYGTADAPAPPEEGALRTRASLTVAVTPPSPENAVAVRYRIDGGRARILPAREAGVDYARQVQYFRATFPPLPDGQQVDYCPQLTCGGRQVPSAAAQGHYPSRFALAAPVPAAPAPAPTRVSGEPRFRPSLELVGRVTAQLSKPGDLIGEGPAGLRVNYYVAGGQIAGPRLWGRILPVGGDWLTIRRDGVAVVDVNSTFETSDGALIAFEYYGSMDLGRDGYARVVRGEFPPLLTAQTCPRLLTGDPRYEWVNRHQFIGVGQVREPEGRYEYDLFLLDNDLRPEL
jgi:hypothetical protein